ncbi:MAG: PKD domain-containing protein [Bacteroidia bacterium]|nr:PKD domain-containing protein [Bacteroidia bacterium]
MKNNIVYCDADNAYYTYGVYIYYGPNNVAPVMTHNNIHLENMTNNGNTWRYAYINGNYNDADDWLNSTYGANSVSVDPNFVDLANSVCIPNSIEMANKAEVNALSTEDITYATRSTTPDMGAYEYLVDLEVVSVDMVGGSECAPWTEEVAITIRNNGAYPITNVPMKYTINGSGGATETITTSIGAGASSSFAFANVPTLVGSNTHVIDVTVDGVDDNPSNSAGQHTIITTASATGGDLTQGATYDGYFNNGNMNDPDVTVKDYVLEYDITRPTKYSASAPGADYGYTLAATTMGGVDVTALGFSLINSDETLMVDPDPSLADSTIYMSITVLDNNTLCDTTFGRYLYVPHFPTASFTPADICLGDVASFKNTSTLGGSDYMLNTWEFDDPDPAVTDDNSDIQDGFWSYTTYGSADVVLTVINGVYPLFEYTATHTITVTPKPELDFKVLNACEGTPIQFNNASGLPAGITGTIAYSWDFAGEGTSAAENPTFTFATPGQRVVTLSAVANGCAATLSKNAYQFEMPTASFVPPTSACNYEEVTFTNTSVIPNDANMGFAWDFNAEGISRLETPSYPFATPGSKTVTLTATSEFGCESMSSETFVLEESPEADFSWDAACNLTPINFTFTGSAPNGGAQSSFVWDYNGENTETNPTSPMHLFGDVGTKEVTLTVADVNGCSNSITKEIDVVLQATAAFDVSDVCEGDEAIFTNSSTVAAGDLEYTWEFGDAGQSTSTDLNPRFSYPITGNTRIVNVTLNAIVPGGCPDVLTKSLTINAAPDATFTADRQGRHVEFTGPSGMTIYQWRFGDGAKSTDQNPSYTYTNVDQGSFEVCLTTKNTICWSDDECQTVVIDLLGVEKLAQNNDMINVYPNPNAGSFNLEIANASDDVVIKVGDILGNEVPVELVDMFNGKYSVNMSAIADGVYFVQVKNGDFYATKRITVSK